MKRLTTVLMVISSLLLINCSGRTDKKSSDKIDLTGEVKKINSDEFRKLVYNYQENKEWKFEGDIPVIIDFYADWCPPCRQLSPLVEEIAGEYKGKVAFYKIDTDKEKELTASLGITNLPTLLYVPAKGQPQVTLGYISKERIKETIKNVLSINN
jgi:thioredoxin 1